MIFLYFLAAIVVNFTNTESQVIEGINVIFNSELSGTEVFWWGLLAAFIIEVITG